MSVLSPLEHGVVARNDAIASENAIHHDDVARRYGFAGGLVPGVSVYGYLCWAPVRRWGRDWLARGTMSARFVQPVYDGDHVVVRAEPTDELSLELVALGPDDRVCATGVATLPSSPLPPPDPGGFPSQPVPPPEQRPPASAEVLARLDLGAVEHTWDADRRRPLLDLLGDDTSLYDELGIAHPGGLIRAANEVLHRSVRLGPWMHVGSTSAHHATVADGETVVTRGRVAELYERKGHRFVELDVISLVGSQPVLSVRHVAIYEPRRRDGTG